MFDFLQYLGAVLNQDTSSLFAAYWALIVLVVAFSIYFIVARAKAKQVILSLMLQAEKNAEAYLLANGDQMFNYVITRAYPLLPPILRLLISYDAFKMLAQKLYDEAKDHLIKGNTLNPPVGWLSSPPQIPEVAPEPVIDSSNEVTATTEQQT